MGQIREENEEVQGFNIETPLVHLLLVAKEGEVGRLSRRV